MPEEKRHSSSSSSLRSDAQESSSSSRNTMDALKQDIKDSLPSLGKDKHHSDISIAVTGTQHSDNESDRTTVASDQASPEVDVLKSSSMVTPTKAIASSNGTIAIRTSTSKLEHFDRLTKVTRAVKNLIIRLDDYDETFVTEMELRDYLQYIADERLIHMPRRGSDWDTVLSTAQFFGLQVYTFGRKIDKFVHGGYASASAALASCQVLLEIGHNQASALVPTFMALYELAMLLSGVARIHELEYMPSHIREAAADIFCDLVYLVGSIASHYKQRISSLKPGSSISISLDTAFGKQIDEIWQAKDTLCDRVWSYKLGNKGFSISLKSIRRRLQPSAQSSVRNALYDEVYERLDRSEDTCNWIKEHLVHFLGSNDKFLNITGSAGRGKSVLAEWVGERLARPLDHRSYSVLSYNFPWDSPKEATPLACVKSFLFQLLERSVGDVALYERLVQVFEVYSKTSNAGNLEATLWDTLRTGLLAAERAETSIVLLTDGCDEMSEKNVKEFHQALRRCVADLSRTHVITFSRPVAALKDGSKLFEITQKEVHKDIESHLKQTLSKSVHYRDMDVREREQIIEGLVNKSKGNFLWAFYVGRILNRETSCDAFRARSKGVSSELSDVTRIAVDRLDLQKNEMLQHLLSFMLITETPFAIEEVTELLATDLHRKAMGAIALNISKFVSEHCSDLLIIRGGRLHFRNSYVQSYMRSLIGKSLLSHKDAHLQLTLRMLLYARLALDGDHELLVDDLEGSAVDAVLRGHRLMGYVMQNWVVHFRQTGFVVSNGEISLPKGFRDIFPESVMFALLERPCWRRYHGHQDTIELHELTLRIRETCFGKEHVTVLQNLITLGHVHGEYSTAADSSIVGARFFYRAAKLGEIILSKTSAIVGSCTHLFLAYTETIVITERTQIVTYREEMIRVWITICKHKYGPSSDEVITWHEKLAKLYISIKEEWRATAVYQELYKIIVVRYGKKSPEAGRIGAFFGTLDVVLKGEKGGKEIGQLEEFIFETSEDLEIHDHLCISMMIKLARSYYSCGEIYLAERLFISLWRRISIIGRVKASVEVHVAKIQIALEYVRFLREVKRTEEATNILICLWAEYEHYHCEAETLIVWIRELGKTCKSFSLFSITLSILTKVWGWFKKNGKTEDEEARRTTVLITEVVEEVTETTTTKKTATTNTTEVTETVVREIYETHYERCKKTKVDRSFFSACMALIGTYFEHQKWSEAETLIKRTLEITWKAILSTDTKITLYEHSSRECILVARRLAKCYQYQGFFEKAEHIHLRIYYACLASLSLEDVLLHESLQVLVDFYEEHHRHEKIIELYISILDRYKKKLGHGHHLTIKTLYSLGYHCKLIGHKDAHIYYREIVTILNKDMKHCHHDALEAAQYLLRHYYHRHMWVELRDISALMWQTVIHHRGLLDVTEELITEIYKRYTYVLEIHIKVEFSVLYKISVEYKEVVITVCGKDSHGFVVALIAFAKMCEKSEKHEHEAVDIYEEVIKKTTTTKTTTTVVTETMVHTVKKRLSKLYVTIITSGRETKKIPLDRAILISIETYEHLKLMLGCWHEETLHQLRDVVILHHKCNTKETHAKMTKLLEISVIEIITTLTVTTTLFNAAISLASLYVSVNLTKQGHELLHQLRHLIIFREGMPCNDITLKLDVHVSKLVFVFLSAFEHGLCSKDCTATYSEIMASIMFESLLYEEYSRVITHEKNTEIILECGAKLRCFWEEHKRVQLLAILDKRLFQQFKTEYNLYFKGVSDKDVRLFYLALLSELGKDRKASKMDFSLLAVRAGSARVKTLLEANDFHCANQLGRIVFRFAQGQKLYQRPSRIQFGYKLAEFLAGIDVPHPGPKDEKMCNDLLTTSREIMAEVLGAFRAADIDFVSLRFEDVSGLVRLLGAQRNWDELESLLSRLWRSREKMQGSGGWSPTTVLDIGKLLIHVKYACGDVSSAVDTAELLCYNLRRSRGRLDLETLAFSRLLAGLYTSCGRKASAMSIHESVLREIGSCYHGNEFGEAYPDRQRLITEAKLHLELLKASHHQLQGWTKPAMEFREVYDRLNNGLGLGLPAFEKWCGSAQDKSLEGGKYLPPSDWQVQSNVKQSSLTWRRRSGHHRPQNGLDVVYTANQWWLVY
ncbi:hypothetical protein CEP52_017051 [Fusarium oligoseptatum]|uniref:Nephrocystin 3-like N-terminal domain-containing protein n=1 Tax=Fusarium oligoseptatum TaxID=2604345 RepID=A0A428RX91_9HYPO|nr:hypothetical protein CEP52_017051 [Fusarium oligoseptatum]